MLGLLYLLLNLLIFCAKGRGSDSLELKMANVLYRHGDRSPVATFPKDEHINFWKQGLGQLTEKGMGQEFQLGTFLKERYVGKMINQTYLRKQVYCRSSDKDRTLMSAEAQMAGLYPPKYQTPLPKEKDWQFWQLIPIHTIQSKYDHLLRPLTADCPRYKELMAKSFTQPEYVKFANKYKEFIRYVSSSLGSKPALTLDKIYKANDMFFCQRAHNLSLPKWVNASVLKKLEMLNKFSFKWLYNSAEKQRLTGGALLGEMIQNMKSFRKHHGKSKKLYVYSAHDTTVSAVLSALKIFSGIPSYSTAFLMELYQNKKTKEYVVRMFYRNDTSRPTMAYELLLPKCSSGACSLEKFASLTAAAIPADYDAECRLKSLNETIVHCEECKHMKKKYRGLLIGVIISLLLVFIAIVGFLVRRCQIKRERLGRSSQFHQVSVQEQWDSD